MTAAPALYTIAPPGLAAAGPAADPTGPAAAPPAAPLGAAEFAACMHPLGPFAPAPRLAAGVSGGPHSLALALLADPWARARGGMLLALIVDHGLRPASAAEATATAALLGAHGIATRVLTLALPPGPAVQARARAARRDALLAACAAAGTPWLLLAHHAGDQAETLLARALHGSAAAGLAAMHPSHATPAALILRPLLPIPAARLEATVAAAGLTPLRDPGNHDPHQGRARLRAALADAPATTAALLATAARFATRRAARAQAVAARLATAVRLHPTGHATLDRAALGEDPTAVAALAALLRAIGGRAFAPPAAAVAALLHRGHGTLAGAWLRGATLLLREPAAVAPPIPATAGALWDGRFRLLGPGDPACTIGALGPAPAIARATRLPAAVVASQPAIRRDGALIACPTLDIPHGPACRAFPMRFAPAAGPVAAP